MFKQPAEYANQMLDCFYGDKEAALIELYNQARQDQKVPCKFWRDVAKEIEKCTH